MIDLHNLRHPETIQAIVDAARLHTMENDQLEIKSNVGKSCLETLAAFSNTHGGLLIFGLTKDPEFLPTPNFDPQKSHDQLVQYCGKLTPHIRPEIFFSTIDEKHPLLIAYVPELPADLKPAFITNKNRYGGAYIRQGESDQKLEFYEVDRLLENKTTPTWDEDEISEATVDDLDKTLLASYLNAQENRRPRTFAQGLETAMKRLVVTKNGHPTLSALIALGEYPQEFFPRLTVTFAHYPGTTKGSVTEGFRMLSSENLTGSIPELVTAGVELVKRNMNTAALIDGVYRQDIPDYPLVAIREALVNAIMHRDYSPTARGAQIQINLFVDRLEITNPGGLFGNVTLRSISESGASSTRNARLAEILSYLKHEGGALAENRGTGLQIIQHSLAQQLMPPAEIHTDFSQFTIIFHRRRVAQKETYLRAKDRVANLLKEHISLSTSELTELTRFSRTTIQKALNQLITAGEVEATEAGRSPRQRYRLSKR